MSKKRTRVIFGLYETSKSEARQLAELRKRSLSNFIEVLVEDEVKKAKESGEFSPEGGDQ